MPSWAPPNYKQARERTALLATAALVCLPPSSCLSLAPPRGRAHTTPQCNMWKTGGATEENYYCIADTGLSQARFLLVITQGPCPSHPWGLPPPPSLVL